ncbi:MAG TPA: hypothetical protein VF230_16800 [Acidimicrobiales bacterium]
MRKSLLAVGIVGSALAALLLVVAPATASSPTALGTDATTVDPVAIKGTQTLPNGRVAIPVKSDKPTWLTPEIELAARNGKGKPQQAPPAAAAAIPGPPADVPAAGYVGIRPGSWMVSPAGCTMNFVFGTPGNYAIGTAGHCIETGQDVILLTAAPPNQDPCVPLSNLCFATGTPVLVNIGTATRSVDGGVGNDFALIPIRPELQSWVYTTIAQVGGPCGKYVGDGTLPDVTVLRGANPIEAGEGVFHYGHGLAVGTGGTPRAGAAISWDTDAFYWASPSMLGDSGSAVRIHDLKAAGDLTHLVVGTQTAPAFVAGTRISKMEQIAGMPLANSPYCV